MVVLASVSPLLSALIGAVGGLASGVVTAFGAEQYKNKVMRTAGARLLHEDFLRQQSTIARAVYSGRWWWPFELLPSQVSDEQYGQVAGGSTAADWDTIAGARGWMAYLSQRRSTLHAERSDDDPPLPLGPDEEVLRKVYNRLALARQAVLAQVGRFGESVQWEPHNHVALREAELGMSPDAHRVGLRLAQAASEEWLS